MGIFDPASLPSSPTSQTNTSSGIAAWAQPYINNYLTQAQNLVSSSQPNSLMQQSYNTAANLQTPGQFGQGSTLANQAGQGLLDTTGSALGYGSQAAGVGQNYANMATNPNSIAAYMNPYIQQSLAPQLAMLNQQQGLQGQGIAANAVGKGAFGGNRETLAQGLNAQNFDLARQAAIGQGYNNAFNAAQQAQQFGAGLGLQGLQAALQGVNLAQQGYQGANQSAGILGNLGAQQNQANLSNLNAQNQMGLQQYNLPYQNLQFMQSMMNNLPISTQSQTGYQAGPNKLSQVAGLGTTAVGAYSLANKLGAFDKSGGGGGNTGVSGADLARQQSGTSGIGEVTPLQDYATPSDMSGDNWSATKGGKVPAKNYASGGLVTLALNNAMKG